MDAAQAAASDAVHGWRGEIERRQEASTMYAPKITTACALLALGLGFSGTAWAQTVQSETQRDIDQQSRIEQGLKDGQLSTGEASKLEQGEAKIDRTESRDLKNGSLSPSEKAQIQNEQNRESARINQDTHNSVTGNPNSASSQRMQADVQRDVNQESRIKQGEKSGSLTNREVSSLQRGQARDDHREAAAGANGHVSAAAQRRIQRGENHQSARVYRAKHNNVHKT
jgi:hypothetical protein